jgi:dTDP-3-amino-2,3,6-trideoxy-4-keto-D-glucose/dTDP-3-amino-3,4,6-trideoxy-alpha-D-glucose/dTDP-2,6-dideoxy-D-kanosamine transaminase
MSDAPPNIAGLNDLRRHIATMHEELTAAADRVISSGWFVLGREVQSFETQFAEYCNVAHCVGVANGTDALELALKALGIGAGSRVATTANAGMYSTAAILALGATPVYVDIDPNTYLLCPQALSDTVSRDAVAAVIVTHLYGAVANMPDILKLTNALAIPVIEDCAQAHGATLQGRKAGSFGTLGTFSFYPTKNLGALGDGGAIVTESDDLASRLRHLRQYGWTRRYHALLAGGRNSRLDELQAALLKVMLPKLDRWNARRREIARLYSAGLRTSRIVCPRSADGGDVVHLYVVRAKDREGLRTFLATSRIPSDVHFPTPDYRQPAVAPALESMPRLEATEMACQEVVSLPCFPELTDPEVALIIERINAWS